MPGCPSEADQCSYAPAGHIANSPTAKVTGVLQRPSLTAHRGRRLLFCRLDQFAHSFSVQFVPFEKPEYLVCGERKIFVHCEDYLSMGGLHRETHSHSMLPEQVDSPRNFVCSLCKCAHLQDPFISTRG